MSADAILCAEGLAVGYGGREVLRDVHLAVGPGEFWFFLGPNGSGKTTLVKALLGDLPLRAGRVIRDPAFRGRASVGFIPQRCDLNPALPTTVREFVSLGLAGLPVARGEETGRIGEALRKAGLEHLERRGYWTLSGGQRQRALIARALVRRPKLLLLDEPTNGLDPAMSASLTLTLAQLHREEGLTLIFVTHETELTERHAPHAALIRDGGVSAGTRAAVLTRQYLAALYEPTGGNGGQAA